MSNAFYEAFSKPARVSAICSLLRRIDMAEGDLLMLLNQTIDLLQQVQTAVGQALDAKSIWPTAESLDENADQLSHAARQKEEPNVEFASRSL